MALDRGEEDGGDDEEGDEDAREEGCRRAGTVRADEASQRAQRPRPAGRILPAEAAFGRAIGWVWLGLGAPDAAEHFGAGDMEGWGIMRKSTAV